MVDNISLLAPLKIDYSPPANSNSTGGTSVAASNAEEGVILNISGRAAPSPGTYGPNGLKVGDSGRIEAEKARMKEQSEPCKTCAERKYQDGSDDMGVSFKAATSVAPEAAAGAVRAHEQEHVSRAYAEGREKNLNVQASVVIHTSICPECKKVYVAGGTTYTNMTMKQGAYDDFLKKMEDMLGMTAEG